MCFWCAKTNEIRDGWQKRNSLHLIRRMNVHSVLMITAWYTHTDTRHPNHTDRNLYEV